jgi:hypothetical protein
MRALVVCACLAIGCASPPSSEESCGHAKTDRPVLVLERGDQTSAIARFADGCLVETPADPVLGYDQNLLGVDGRAFVGLNEQGTLQELDVQKLGKLGPAMDAYADMPGSTTIHGIYGVAIDAAKNLWVSRADAGSIAILRPDGSLDGTVDLSDLDPDGVPDMNGILIQGGLAYVALGFLEYKDSELGTVVQPRQRGAIVVIDTATREIVDRIDLAGHNPVQALVPTSNENEIVVATPGVYDEGVLDEIAKDDGIDRVRLDGSGEVTQLVSEAELGGSVSELVWGGPTEVYAIVLGEEPGINPTRVVQIDPTRPAGQRVMKELARAPYFEDHDAAAYVHVGLALTEHELLVGDKRSGEPKILVFSRATGEALAPVPTRVHPPAALLALP